MSEPISEEPRVACAVLGLAYLLRKEPRLEAVAFDPSAGKIAIATIGPEDASLARKVTETVALRIPRCCEMDEAGYCQACHEIPSRRLSPRAAANVTFKRVLGNLLIERHTCATAPRFWRWHDLKWPKLVTRQPSGLGDEDVDEWKFQAVLAASCLVLGIIGFITALPALGLPAWVSIAAFAGAYVAGAWEAAEEAWEKVLRFQFDIHFLMLAVAVGAASIGAWKEGALLLFLFSASGAMEHYAMGRTRREIDSLLKGAPKTAIMLDQQGREEEVMVESLQPGMRVRVRPNSLVPVDVRVRDGKSACDESTLTGESAPVEKAVGDEAQAGTMNLWGVLEGEVLRRSTESAYQKVIRLIETAQHLRAPAQKFTDCFGTQYTAFALGLCAVMFFVWWAALGLPAFENTDTLHSAFYRTMTLLVVLSPCALVLSVPSAFLAAIARGARKGVLFRGGAALEQLATVKTVAFDKTGTLTEGDLQVGEFRVLEGEEKLAGAMLFNLARLSEHPLARSIQRWGHLKQWKEHPVLNFRNVPGQGVAAVIDGEDWKMGRWSYVAGDRDRPTEAPSLGDAEVWVSGPGVLGRALLRDRLRESAKGLVESLQAMGLKTVMLTGDRPTVAEQIAARTGIDEVRAGLLPEQKLEAIEELREKGARPVAMVGDGVNDAPSLAAADVGVAMGARGSDAALEQADIVLMKDRLEQFILARSLSTRSVRIIRQNIAIALGTVVIMALASLGFPVPLALGVMAHEGSTVLVVLNSLRLLGGRG